MTIAEVGSGSQRAGNVVDAGTTVSASTPGSVSVGSLIVVCASAWRSTNNDPFVVGDVSNSGTATLGTWSIDVGRSTALPTTYLTCAIFSAIVTGAGTLTVQVAGMPSGSYGWVGVDEFSGSWDATRFETSAGNDSATSGAPDSGNATSAGAALFVGVGCSYSGDNPAGYANVGSWSDIFTSSNGATSHTGEAAFRIVTSGTTDKAAWTTPNNAGWQAIVGVFKEAAGSSPALDDSGSFPGFEAQSNPLVISVW